MKSSVFFQRYTQFAEAAGERWMPAKKLPNQMHRRGFTAKRTKSGVIYLGIELENPQEDWRAV